MLPPTKLYFASPVHLAAGAGNPAASSAVKSNAADVTKGFLCLFFSLREPVSRLPGSLVFADDLDRPALADESIVSAAEPAEHQRLDHGFGDFAGGRPVDHEVGAGSAPHIRGRDKDFDGREGLQGDRGLEITLHHLAAGVA